jgi:hypothetical protein
MAILPLLLLALSPIQIDGTFQDWPEGITNQNDAHFLCRLIELPSEQCLQQLSEQHVVELGQYTILFSPLDKGYGISCKKGTQWFLLYEAGVVFAPTTAASKFELRVHRIEEEIPIKIFNTELKGDFRVVSWNVQFGNLLEDKKRGSRLLRALKPDVLLLQDLDGDDTSENISEFLHVTYLLKTLLNFQTIPRSLLISKSSNDY